jgi:hypothetical protein
MHTGQDSCTFMQGSSSSHVIYCGAARIVVAIGQIYTSVAGPLAVCQSFIAQLAECLRGGTFAWKFPSPEGSEYERSLIKL